MLMKQHKFNQGDLVILKEDFMDDDSFVKEHSLGKVMRYDDSLVVVSMPNYVTICPHESDLELVSHKKRSATI